MTAGKDKGRWVINSGSLLLFLLKIKCIFVDPVVPAKFCIIGIKYYPEFPHDRYAVIGEGVGGVEIKDKEKSPLMKAITLS